MRRPSIRLRLTLGVLLILGPFLFALSHLLMAMHHSSFPHALDWDRLRPLYVLSGMAVAATGAGVWLIIGRTLSPIRSLAEQAKVAESAVLVAPSTDPEMAELVDTLNDLLRRVAESGEAKSRFYSAVSHELRTPLQALSGHLELAASKPRSEEEYRAVVEEAQAQTRRLHALVEGVLLLHRLDVGGEVPTETARVDLVVDRFTESHEVTWLAKDPLSVRCFPAHLEILVSNLVSNALRHGSDLAVSVNAEGFQISNSMKAPGTDVASLNQPFPNPSRGGNGLGIPIVQAICRANGWRLALAKSGDRFIAVVTF